MESEEDPKYDAWLFHLEVAKIDVGYRIHQNWKSSGGVDLNDPVLKDLLDEVDFYSDWIHQIRLNRANQILF